MIKKLFGSFILKIFSTGMAFITSLYISNIMELTEWGNYSFCISVVTIIAVFSGFGFPRVLVRLVVNYSKNSDWSKIKGLYNFINILFLFTLSLISLVVIFYYLIRNGGSLDNEKYLSLFVSLFMVPLLTISSSRDFFLRGLHEQVLAQFPEFLIKPIAFFVIVYFFKNFINIRIDALLIIALLIIANVVSTMSGCVILKIKLAKNISTARASYDLRRWIKQSMPFCLLGGAFVLTKQIDIVMLGTFDSIESSGIYRAISRYSDFVVFILASANTILQPIIVKYCQTDKNFLRQKVSQISIIVFLTSLIVTVVYIVKGRYLLSLFGEEFTCGYVPLIIISGGQLFSAFSGSVGTLLNMAGYEKISLMAVLISTSTNIVLNFALIPRFSMLGAAIATTISLVIWNLILLYFTKRYIKINPTPLGFWSYISGQKN